MAQFTELRLWLLMAVLGGLCSCTELDEQAADPPKNLPGMELYGSEVKYMTDGHLQFMLRAGRVMSYEDRALTVFDGKVRVDFFDANGNHSATLTSNGGEIEERQNRLTAKERVVVKSDSGLVLRTEELYYDRNLDRVYSDEFVTIITQNDSLSGYGFSSAPDLNDWEIKNTSGQTWREKK